MCLFLIFVKHILHCFGAPQAVNYGDDYYGAGGSDNGTIVINTERIEEFEPERHGSYSEIIYPDVPFLDGASRMRRH